jgi:putative oxidoreductase
MSGDLGFADPIGIGEVPSLILTVFAEFFCGIALLIGFKSRLVSIFLAFTMFVAAFRVHWSDPWGKKELALLFFGIYVALILMGGGKLGVDRDN